MERTFVMVKPDGVQRGLVAKVINSFEQKGCKLVALKMMKIDRELAEKHYGEHKGKPFFTPLVDYIISGPVVAMVLEGKDVITAARNVMGATNPLQAAIGTIRGDYGMDIGRNVVHGSDSPASAQREINLFFLPEEITEWSRTLETWIFE
ncbi:Nucleoside-diphosphate kinase [Desulfofarcimen acetoxidans DSM 771]|uniref:Nucleoside diphosphate kinase n=1 Tax=Desulfofarcimen acetoxidans (strain ATCC 49208 / DSM 771 / KCTC 5769 / VKM B-1644 / 5575) TaxID=485916 RepID=C8W3S9_DESAS|nr:nucleoside-diphosphate kinase [Desulfofarcimen acetoxidans]ACV61183.1 Nucleoside-diphosphate kinase [Desulfofarcimen acetoxidans DSM 771]